MKGNQLKFGVYLSYVSIFITNITNLILTPFIIRSLGQSEYGLYMLIGAFVGYIAVLDFGLSNTTIRFVSKYRALKDKKGEENFLYLTFIIYSLISFIILIVGTVIYFNLDSIFKGSLSFNEIELAKMMFLILVIALAITLPMNSFTGIIIAYEKFIFPRSLTIIRTLIRLIILMILLLMGYKSLAIVIVDAILNFVMMFATILYVFMKLKVRIKLHIFNWKLVKEIFLYSSLIFISVVVDQIYWRIGHLILGIFASTTEVAVFAIGMLFAQYFITFSTAISGVFLPRITKMVVNEATNSELTHLMAKIGRLQFLVLGFILGGFLILGKSFILLWAGEGFEESWIIALIVLIPLTIVLTQTLGISILQAKNKHGFRALTYLFISIINTFISIYLVQYIGSIGAAIGTSLSLIIGNIIVMNLYYHYKIGLNMVEFYKEISNRVFLTFLLVIIVSIPLKWIFEINWVSLVFQGLIFGILYFVAMWLYGMNKYEKTLLVKEFSKVKSILIRVS